MRDARATREKLLKAASHLFYGAGIKAVSVDAVAEKAGVTKKTLYHHFRSKDDLVAAYLLSRDQPNLALFAGWFDAADGPPAERVRAIFTHLAAAARGRRWKGCGFLRTAAELVDMPGHPAVKVAAAHKRKLEAWLADVLAVAELADAAAVARQVVLLIDGAFSAMLVHRDAGYIESAGEAAALLVAAAGKRPPRAAATTE